VRSGCATLMRIDAGCGQGSYGTIATYSRATGCSKSLETCFTFFHQKPGEIPRLFYVHQKKIGLTL